VSSSTIERVLTPRLVCERLQRDHAAELFRLLLDPRVTDTLWPGSEPPTEDDVLESLEAKIDHWERHGFGMWLVRDRATGEMVGRGGLQYTYWVGLDEIEAGWAVMPERWGQGLATELAHACVGAAFGPLGLRELVAFTMLENLASRRVMEKAGFTYERDIVHAGLPHVLYRRVRREPC
jgi:RimJ/RimL family protein N-acetyltransferase